jgi:hypothetical protein
LRDERKDEREVGDVVVTSREVGDEKSVMSAPGVVGDAGISAPEETLKVVNSVSESTSVILITLEKKLSLVTESSLTVSNSAKSLLLSAKSITGGSLIGETATGTVKAVAALEMTLPGTVVPLNAMEIRSSESSLTL